MTWTTPQAVTTGTASSSQFNAETVDNLQHLYDQLLGDRVACRVHNSAAISLTTSGTPQALTFDSERFDAADLHSTSTNTSRITVVNAGIYHVGGHVSFAANGTGYRQIDIRVNGTTVVGAQRTSAISGTQTFQSIATLVQLSATDYVQLFATQTSGGALNVESSAQFSPEFWLSWVSP